ncbi:hypothetical protein [Nocardioides conyzicola]|uniref:Excreted virulence factor EspC (Type VII ESX diderm) n=1 Tax=Nocardioides conyzicola TaxID=1651781 RepID=A0ABP8WUV7_9ACTN
MADPFTMAVPLTMGTTARAWDERHLDLEAAAGQVADAPTAGFTSGVAGAAARFASTWQRHVSDLGATAETQADGLRASAADYARTDQLVASDHLLLDDALREER